MLEKLIETGEKIYNELDQGKKGNKLERITWLTTSLRYIESYLDDSIINDFILDLDLLNESLTAENAGLVLATLKAELALQSINKEPDINERAKK